VPAIAAFAQAHDVPFPLLSDVDSAVIRDYGILNTQVQPGDVPIYGIPFPGSYVVDEDGVVVAKFFHDSYKKRDSSENLIDAALGRIILQPYEPTHSGGDPDVRVSATLHGGGGVLKQGSIRHVVVRFELRDGLHIYGEPVAEGMIPTTVEVRGPEGIRVGEPILAPTETLRLPGLDIELQVWSGTVDISIPVYASAPLLSELRAITTPSITLEVTVRYQACNDETCLLPRTEKLPLEVGLEPVALPDLSLHSGGGQHVTTMDSEKHLRRLVLRKLRSTNPLAVLRGALKLAGLNRAARRRRRERTA
jgi:hypothetical protein